MMESLKSMLQHRQAHPTTRSEELYYRMYGEVLWAGTPEAVAFYGMVHSGFKIALHFSVVSLDVSGCPHPETLSPNLFRREDTPKDLLKKV